MAVTNSLQGASTAPSPGKVTLGDIAALARLAALPGSTFDVSRIVVGGAAVERPDAVDQLEPDWVAITEGSGFGGPQTTEPILREFVRGLMNRSAAALVVRLGRVWDRIPEPVVDEATHQGLPIMTMPTDTTPAALLRAIHETAGNHDYAVLGRALSVQTDLIDALTVDDVERELVDRLSSRLGVSAILYDGTREVLASQGEAPIHLIKDRIDPTADAERRLVVGRWNVSLSPLTVPGTVFWLALGWTGSQELTPEIVRSTRYALQKLLSAHITTRTASRRQDQIQRAQLLSELLEGVSPQRLARLRDQLVLLDFPREGQFQLHLLQPRSPSRGVDPATGIESATDPVMDKIQALAEAQSTSLLMADLDKRYAVLLPPSAGLTRELVAAFPNADHGVSNAFADLGATRQALRQAEMSLMTGARRGRLTPFDDVGFINFILAQVPVETLQDKSREVLAGIPVGGPVEDTIIEYLKNGMDIQATARTMHLHPNSVRYRLAKAEQVLDRSLADPETITLLYLTLHDRLAMSSPVGNQSTPAEATTGARAV